MWDGSYIDFRTPKAVDRSAPRRALRATSTITIAPARCVVCRIPIAPWLAGCCIKQRLITVSFAMLQVGTPWHATPCNDTCLCAYTDVWACLGTTCAHMHVCAQKTSVPIHPYVCPYTHASAHELAHMRVPPGTCMCRMCCCTRICACALMHGCASTCQAEGCPWPQGPDCTVIVAPMLKQKLIILCHAVQVLGGTCMRTHTHVCIYRMDGICTHTRPRAPPPLGARVYSRLESVRAHPYVHICPHAFAHMLARPSTCVREHNRVGLYVSMSHPQ